MIKKMIRLRDLKIKWMLWGLVFVGVFVTLLLSGASLYWVIPNLVENQKRLTEIVMPMEMANEKVRMTVSDFTIRKYAIARAEDLNELAQFEDRKHLEQSFVQGVHQLRELSSKAKAIDASEKIDRLEKLYAIILDKDAAILESVRKNLKLEQELSQSFKTLETAASELHKNSERLSETLNLALQKPAEANQKKEEPRKPLTTLSPDQIGEMQQIATDLRMAVTSLINDTRQILMTEAQQTIILMKSKISKTIKLIDSYLAALTQMSAEKSSEVADLIQKIEADYALIRPLLTEENNSLMALRNQQLSEQKNMDSLHAALNEITAPLTTSLNDLQSLSMSVRQWADEEASRVSDTAHTGILLVSMSGIAVMILAGLWIQRRIIRPINKLVAFADTISQGDLTIEIQKDYNDEVGELVFKLSNMAHNLNALIGQVQQSGIQVTSSATELSATSKEQEAVMRTQLESTNYVVKSVGEISNVSEELVETMQKVAAMSEQTAEFASSGQTDLSQMEEAMRHMENASKSISAKLEAINEKAANITSVVTTITKVADQTNLLSLNAAIEAEKAGEYGRGFTVVAREIRRLADQTAVATLDIEQMVQEMQSAVSAGVMEMDAFITEVQRSAENVGKISVQLSRIIEQVQALSPSFEGVNESMQMQAGNAQQINASMVNLSEEMQQTVDSLRESFMAIEQLNDAAKGLQDEVSRFKVI